MIETMKYIKNEKDFEQFNSKEIEVFKYNGVFDVDFLNNAPDWFTEAIENETILYFGKCNNKDRLLIRPYMLIVEDGYYIVRKLSSKKIAACTEEFLNEYFDKV